MAPLWRRWYILAIFSPRILQIHLTFSPRVWSWGTWPVVSSPISRWNSWTSLCLRCLSVWGRGGGGRVVPVPCWRIIIYKTWSSAIWKGSHNPRGGNEPIVINHWQVLGWSSKMGTYVSLFFLGVRKVMTHILRYGKWGPKTFIFHGFLGFKGGATDFLGFVFLGCPFDSSPFCTTIIWKIFESNRRRSKLQFFWEGLNLCCFFYVLVLADGFTCFFCLGPKKNG